MLSPAVSGRRSGLLAFINTDMMNPLFYTVAPGVEDAAHAAGMIMFIPTLLFVFFAQRYLIRGLTVGGVKD
jgi:ABC-type glycerol-3-phosphate transport system permease component